MNLIKKAQKYPGLREARSRAESGDGCFGLSCSRPGGRSHGMFKGWIIKPAFEHAEAVQAELVEALCAVPFGEFRANGELKGQVNK